MLSGYGADIPRLMQLSVHCDHLRSVFHFGEQRSSAIRRKQCCFDDPFLKNSLLSPIRRIAGCFDHPCLATFSPTYGEKKAVLSGCSMKNPPRYTATGVGRTFMACLHFSPYGESHAVLTSVFLKKMLPDVQPREDRKVRCFFIVFEKSSPALRRNAGRFERVFQKDFSIYSHGRW